MIKLNPGLEYRLSGKSKPGVDDDGRLSGRAAPFNSQTMIGEKPWGFRESIKPGAFAKSIKDGDVVLLDQHDMAKPMARQSAGTLVLAESKNGLDWDAEPAATTYAQDAVANARAGNYGGCSFGFEVVRDVWHYNKDDDVDERTLHEVKLHEISTVTFPAYSDTMVSARSSVDAAYEASIVGRSGNPKPYGDVEYADSKNGKYPIDTKAHAKAAWDYINVAKNADEYPLNGVTLESVKNKIMEACHKFGINCDGDTDHDNPPNEKKAAMLDIVSRFEALSTDHRAEFIAWLDANKNGEPDSSTRTDADRVKALMALRLSDLSR